jgi:NAD(P)-dependent dehydrogenase (short-subunit alcohol dehydrogenase family)
MPTITDKAVLITGSNRGIGRALLDEALRRGARRVYAGARVPQRHPDERVTPLALDVTDPDQVRRAAEAVDSLDLLINNAGIAIYDDLTDPAVLERHFAVNLYGVHRVIEAFLPLLTDAKGAIANNLSVNGLAAFPLIPAYSISKAAAFSMTQSLRTLLAARGVTVHAVLTGIVDTDMTRGVEMPKASPESVARAVFDGLEKDEEDIFPDPMAEAIAAGWRGGPVKALEQRYADFARGVSAGSRDR